MVLQAIKYTPAATAAIMTTGETAMSFNQSTTMTPPTLEILNQLLLPHESIYESIRTCEEAHAAIKEMKVRGAPAIAIVAALALAVEAGGQLWSSSTRENHAANGVKVDTPALTGQSANATKDALCIRLEYLKTSRPTAVNLGDAVGKLSLIAGEAACRQNATGDSVLELYIKAAEQMLVDDVLDNQAIGEHGSRWIQAHTVRGKQGEKVKILTHCNTGSLATAGYGTALGVIRSLHAANVLDHVYCSETRPYNQGSRLTAYELLHDQIPATLVTDSMAAALLLREGDKLAAVVVGADRVAANGDTANKIGTYSLAVLARHHGAKFLVAAPRTTIDLKTASGKDIVIEERAAVEVTRIRGPQVDLDGTVDVSKPATVSTAALGLEVWNPAFDVTPAELIDGVITEVGVIEKIKGVFDFNFIFRKA